MPLGMRRDEPMPREGALPFLFIPGIERTAERPSAEANWHDGLEIELCAAGGGFILLDGERHSFHAGEVAVAGSNVLHYTGTEGRIVYHCLIIDAGFCRRAGIKPEGFAPILRSEAIVRLLGQLEACSCKMEDPCRIARCLALILQILIALAQHHSAQVPPSSSGKSLATVRRSIAFIQENYARPLRLEEIARAALVDKYSLSRAFRQAAGQTVVEYINSYRCRRAAELLAAGHTVSEAARLTGFQNLSFFSRTFHRYTGALPSAMKSKLRPGETAPR